MLGYLIATYVLPGLPRETNLKNAKNSYGHIFPDVHWRTPEGVSTRPPGRSFRKTCRKIKSGLIIGTIDGGRK